VSVDHPHSHVVKGTQIMNCELSSVLCCVELKFAISIFFIFCM
jgi:hypothetical protein